MNKLNLRSSKFFLKFLIIIIVIIFLYNYFKISTPETIKVGILHSRTGTLALSEEPVIRTTLLAIKEINESGGILGKYIEAKIADGKSDWSTFAREAERLIKKEKVNVIFGCWTSASRKEVKPIVEKYNNLLFYPVQYEGLESSKNIVYTGAAPNQQIIPGTIWSLINIGKKVFLVGSDYIFPRIANAIIKDVVPVFDGKILGEEYIPLGSKKIDEIIKKIEETKPDLILNTINGDSNIAFFKAINDKFQRKIAIMSFSVSEPELEIIKIENAVDTYACWNYFQSIDSEQNHIFEKKIINEYGTKQLINDPMEAAYFGVHLWAQTIKSIKTTNIEAVRKYLNEINYLAPEGMVQIEITNQHTWKTIRIGKVNNKGQFNIIWQSEKPKKPEPYPNNLLLSKFIASSKTQDQWEEFLAKLYKSWGNKWSA